MNVLSLFTGVGGLDLGLKIAVPEARVVCSVERDDYARRVLLARMSDGSLDAAPLWDDVCSFDGRPWRGVVDCICGGFPCQDISTAGRREGIKAGNRSGLWFEFARIIGEVGPRLVFVENVAALLGRGMDTVLGDLSDLGFDAIWCTLSACAVGAPHTRERVFLLAYSRCIVWEWRVVAAMGDPAVNHQAQAEWRQGGTVSEGGTEAIGGIRGSWWRGPEPGFPRMAARAECRMDRLRILGNTVVPLAAAAAFSLLAERAGLIR